MISTPHSLFTRFFFIALSQSCHDEEDEDGEEVKSFEVGFLYCLSGLSFPVQHLPFLHFLEQEKEMEKQKLLYQQERLHDRGAAEMVLQTISASKGTAFSFVFLLIHE